VSTDTTGKGQGERQQAKDERHEHDYRLDVTMRAEALDIVIDLDEREITTGAKESRAAIDDI
jgi:hypothetical protein